MYLQTFWFLLIVALNKVNNTLLHIPAVEMRQGEPFLWFIAPCFTPERRSLDVKLEGPMVLQTPCIGLVKISLNMTVHWPTFAATLSVPFRETRHQRC